MLRTFFVRLSENPSLRNFAERSSLGHRISGRFVAGTEIADAVRATQAVNRAGMSVTIDNLGENVTNPDEARHSAQLYHEILDAIVANQLDANISLKLTHMGLDVDEKLARDIVSGLVAKAASMNPPGFVRVDMEGDILIIAGMRPLPSGGKSANIIRLEIPYGRFERRIALRVSRLRLAERELVNGCLVLTFAKS